MLYIRSSETGIEKCFKSHRGPILNEGREMSRQRDWRFSD